MFSSRLSVLVDAALHSSGGDGGAPSSSSSGGRELLQYREDDDHENSLARINDVRLLPPPPPPSYRPSHLPSIARPLPPLGHPLHGLSAPVASPLPLSLPWLLPLSMLTSSPVHVVPCCDPHAMPFTCLYDRLPSNPNSPAKPFRNSLCPPQVSENNYSPGSFHSSLRCLFLSLHACRLRTDRPPLHDHPLEGSGKPWGSLLLLLWPFSFLVYEIHLLLWLPSSLHP